MSLPVLIGFIVGIVVLINVMALGMMSLARHADDRASTLQRKGTHDGHSGSPPHNVG